MLNIIKFYICLLLMTLNLINGDLTMDSIHFEGDMCVSRSGKEGTCIKLNKCPKAMQDLKINRVLPINCGFSENEPIVCCEKTKSEVKCEEYSEEMKKYITYAIVGGESVSSAHAPHMVAIGFGTKDKIEWKCGGSLISESFVLTAAHCLRHRELGEVKFVRLGDSTLDNKTRVFKIRDPEIVEPNIDNGHYFQVKRSIRHPDYKPPIVYNDIALIELDRPVKFGFTTKPACLHSRPVELPMDVYATGWGLTSHAGNPSVYLQQVTLQLVNSTYCINSYRSASKRKLPNGILEEKQVCAGSNEEKDTCQGDSGGPLHTYLWPEMLYGIVGTTAFGKACGTPDVPSVYTRVSYYIPWIESIVWPK